MIAPTRVFVLATRAPRLFACAALALGGCASAERMPPAASADTTSIEALGPFLSCEGASTLQRDLSYASRFDPERQIYVTETGELCRFDDR